jgi:hypothetical protein
MKIDAQTGWYHGKGDAVCFAWIGEGMIAAGDSVEFFAAGELAEILRMFQMPVTYDPTDAVVTHLGYETAVRTGSPLNYVDWMAHHLGVTHPVKRPRLDLIPMDREMGRASSADVLIFPEAAAMCRKWPKTYFVELGRLLQLAGFKVKIAIPERDYDFFMPFHCLVGESWNFLAGAIQAARLVIGNDTGPSHLAGTIGTTTIVIQGPTTERIYSHIPEVISYRKKALPCAGCHCLPPPYRSTCEVGCVELYRTFPEEVAEFALQILAGQEIVGQAHRLPSPEPATGAVALQPLETVAA